MKHPSLYLDIYLYGRFVCQLKFNTPPITKSDGTREFYIADIEKYVTDKRPSLKDKDFKVRFSNQRV
jgi:hypothetical protein